MQQPLPTGTPTLGVPTFYVTGRQPLRPGAILLAIVTAVCALSSIRYAMGHAGSNRFAAGGAGRSAQEAASAGGDKDDDKDDPSQIDTIVLGDPADAPVPGRRGDHVSPVHPTILVSLPRFGDQVGLIPATTAGHLLYGWLAAFNQANYSGLGSALPNASPASASDAQMELRQQTGGFTLLSAREVTPGVLVFRLHDETPSATEVLGTLQVRQNSSPATIASFSLRAVPTVRPETTAPLARTQSR